MVAGEGGLSRYRYPKAVGDYITKRERKEKINTTQTHTQLVATVKNGTRTNEGGGGKRRTTMGQTQGSGGGVRMSDICNSVCIRRYARTYMHGKLQEVNARGDERRCHFPFPQAIHLLLLTSPFVSPDWPCLLGIVRVPARKQGHQIGPGGSETWKEDTKVRSGQAELIPAAAPPRKGIHTFIVRKSSFCLGFGGPSFFDKSRVFFLSTLVFLSFFPPC